jgi:hypothetical protein
MIKQLHFTSLGRLTKCGAGRKGVQEKRSMPQYLYTLSFTCNSTAELGKSSKICSWSSSILIEISFLQPKNKEKIQLLRHMQYYHH